jgi:NTE family protein
MGALVGGLYAAGYSPQEIETIFLSEDFKIWAQGTLQEKYVYYLREKELNPSLINLKVSTDTIWETSLPTNLISPTAMDYGLMEYLAPATAIAKNNFDSLFIPFRCVASDIIKKEPFVFIKGQLSTAIRASMSYPFYLSPVSYEDMLLFDGGLYNNFPSDIMYEDFLPDFIIGSNVSDNFEKPKEDNIVSQVKAIIADDTRYSIDCNNSIIIEPPSQDYSLFDFEKNAELIEIGYQATLKHIPEILEAINQNDSNDVSLKRAAFRSQIPPLIFNQLNISGLNKNQNKYIEKSIRFKKDTLSVGKLKPEYIKISSDDKIKSLYPQAIYNEETNYFTLDLKAKKEKNLFVSFGGVFSSRPINEGYIGIQYNMLGRVAVSLLANSYFGKLHNSVSAGFRLDIPFVLPFYWKNTFTVDGWDYFKSKDTFFEDTKPSFLVTNDQYVKSEIGFPVSFKGKIVVEGTAGELMNNYYQTKEFISIDTTDKTRFRNFSVALGYERNSLNQKQYATAGSAFSLKGKFIRGQEHYDPGSTSNSNIEFDTILDWGQMKLSFVQYFNKKKKIRFGVFTEALVSNQSFFNNYTASILMSPAFQPLPESKTLFQENFRAQSYLSGGLKAIYLPFKNVQIRAEGYVFQPYQVIFEDINKRAAYGKKWADRNYLGSLSVVYYTPIGPLAFNANYYEKFDDHWSFLVHFGYLIFNKKSLE